MLHQRHSDPVLRELERTLMAHRYLYYVECSAIISDAKYDRLDRVFLSMLSEDAESPIKHPGSELRSSYSMDEIELAHEWMDQ